MTRRLLHLMLASGLALAALVLLAASVSAAGRAAPPGKPDAPAVTFPVNTFVDTPDHSTADHLCLDASGNCSLRAAVQQLDHDSGGSITLPPGTYVLTNTSNGDLQFQKNITLTGAASNTTLIVGNPAGWAHRLARVQDGADVIISGVTLQGGHPSNAVGGGVYVVTGTLTLSNSRVLSNTSDVDGGGIYNTGRLNVLNSAIEDNTSGHNGGGIDNNAEDLAITPGAQLTVTNSSIVSNTADFGAGVYNDDLLSRGSTFISGGAVSGNHANLTQGGGGGVYVHGGTVTLAAVAVERNSGQTGGGLLANGGSLYVFVSRVESNTTSSGGGGLEGIGAFVQMVGSTVAGNQSQGDGAGIGLLDGTLDLEFGGVHGNISALSGGGLHNAFGTATINGTGIDSNQAAAGGGGIYNAGGVITVQANDISRNSTAPALAGAGSRPNTLGLGGGVYNEPGSQFFAQQVVLANNTSPGSGGGATNFGSMAWISSTISGNVAANGGGLYNTLTGTLVITASTLSGNQALSEPGGGLSNDGSSALTFLTNSTVSGNRSATSGGGLSAEQGRIELNSVTVAGNTADSDGSGTGDGGGLFSSSLGAVFAQNTLVGLNTDRGGQAPDCAGLFISYGYNLIQNAAGCNLFNTLTGNITGVDPRLWPLGDYGGPTRTQPLMAGSPALEAGNPAGCQDRDGNTLTTDQRGDPRPAGPRCDIGADEGAHLLVPRLFLPLLWR